MEIIQALAESSCWAAINTSPVLGVLRSFLRNSLLPSNTGELAEYLIKLHHLALSRVYSY